MSDRLRIAVNPNYDHDDPDSNEFGYWNPVTATNDLIRLANAALDIAQSISDARHTRVTLKQQLRELERQLDELERRVLNQDPLSPTEAKTLKTVAAAVYRRFDAHGIVDQAKALQDQMAVVVDQLDHLDDRIETGHMWLKTNSQVSDNIQTALSFYKDERKRAYQY
jgi:hypothetical protein